MKWEHVVKLGNKGGKEMEYREIIKENIREVLRKKAKVKKKSLKQRYDWVIANLIADLRDYETQERERWLREPRDRAWIKYSRQTGISKQEMDRLFRQIWKEFFQDDFF